VASKNFAYSTVATAPSPASSGTSLVVAAGTGSRFPAVPFKAAIWPSGAVPTPANAEIVTVTAVATDTLTITRAQESSSARTVVIGDQLAATLTAAMYDALADLTQVRSAISATTVLTTQELVLASGTIVLTLPTAATAKRAITVKNVGTGSITVKGPGSETIDGATQVDMNRQYEAQTFIPDGTNWLVI
jgi:hypothetical protein